MKRTFLILAVFTLTQIGYAQEMPDELKPVKKLSDGTILIDNFEDDKVGSLPSEWYNRDGKRKARHPEEAPLFHYSVKKESGNQYLHFEHTDARHLNFPLVDKKGVDIFETPILTWKWRVNKLPEGANEDYNDTNDTAASIYVVFDMGRVALFKKVPKSIRYTWSSSLEKGTELTKLFGNQRIVVVESGREHMGKWVTFERNIVEDYRRLFGDDPPAKPLAILILSDGDSTGSTAEADYDDIMLKKEKTTRANTH